MRGNGLSGSGRVDAAGSWLRGLAWASAVGLFVVILMGTTVTDTGSELGCGRSWPLCHGRLLPGPALHTLVEFSHRAVAGLVGLLVVAVAVWAWRRHGRNLEVRVLALLSAGFVWVQALLGAAAVMWPQAPAVLALHFGFSLIALASAVLLAALLGERGGGPGVPPAARGVRLLALGLVLYTYALVYLGAFVAHTGSGLGCLGWPLCGGALVPRLAGATLLAFGHRAVAAGLVLLLLGFRIRVGHLTQPRPDLVRAANLELVAVLAQAGSGALLVLSRLATGALLLHATLVSLLFSAVAYGYWLTLRGHAPAVVP